MENYWTSAGSCDEIYYYVKHNVAVVRDDLALMVSEIPVRVNEMLLKENSLGYVYQLARESEKMLNATLTGRTAEVAIRQIKEKQYALRFLPKLGEKRYYTGNVLAVGISYDRSTQNTAA